MKILWIINKAVNEQNINRTSERENKNDRCGAIPWNSIIINHERVPKNTLRHL